jgi:hypothetical protein
MNLTAIGINYRENSWSGKLWNALRDSWKMSLSECKSAVFSIIYPNSSTKSTLSGQLLQTADGQHTRRSIILHPRSRHRYTMLRRVCCPSAVCRSWPERVLLVLTGLWSGKLWNALRDSWKMSLSVTAIGINYRENSRFAFRKTHFPTIPQCISQFTTSSECKSAVFSIIYPNSSQIHLYS